MATQSVLIDDMDGGPADSTERFSLNGVDYEIDLNSDNAESLAMVLAPYISMARRVGGRVRRPHRRHGLNGLVDTPPPTISEMRAWAVGQGYAVSERGKLSRAVQDAYADAHS